MAKGTPVLSIPGSRSEHFSDPQLGRFQVAIEKATQGARGCPLVDGALITGVFLVGGGPLTDVPHTLGRAWRGYLVTSITSATIVYLAPLQRDVTKFLSVIPSAQTTADFWIF